MLCFTDSEHLRATCLKDDTISPRDERVLRKPSSFWFFVTNDWDVFSNVGTFEPWWRLGNLEVDSVETIIRRFEKDETLGLDVLLNYPRDRLVREYGDPNGLKIYSAKDDLLSLYLAKHCEKM